MTQFRYLTYQHKTDSTRTRFEVQCRRCGWRYAAPDSAELVTVADRHILQGCADFVLQDSSAVGVPWVKVTLKRYPEQPLLHLPVSALVLQRIFGRSAGVLWRGGSEFVIECDGRKIYDSREARRVHECQAA